MEKFDDFIKLNRALASFMNDFSLLKDKNNLSQKEIAKKSGTTQSAISRIETMNTNPSYKVLARLSDVVGGSLYLTPMGDMTITVPFGMQEKIKSIAEAKGMSVRALLLELIKKEIYEKFTTELELQSVNEYDYDSANHKTLTDITKFDDSFDDLLSA